MSAHAKAKQRVHTHKGVDFIVVPGSRREQVLLDLFQSEDRLAVRAPIVDTEDDSTPWITPFLVGACAGAAAAILAAYASSWLV